MMAITTNNSINVKPVLRKFRTLGMTVLLSGVLPDEGRMTPGTGFGYLNRYFNSMSYCPGFGFSVTSIEIPDESGFEYLPGMFTGLGMA
jgi:hypothetical protein